MAAGLARTTHGSDMRRDPNLTHAHARGTATEGDVVEVLIDLLVQIPADESNSSISSIDHVEEDPGPAHHGLMIETDDGSRFHLGVVKIA